MVIGLKISDVNSPKPKKPSVVQNLSFYFTEYCENTSIHGLKFLGERRRSPIEKIWWLMFIGASLYFCITLIMDVYRKWENSPVVVTFATSQTPIWQIPFPAITICPAIKSDRLSYNFTKEMLWRLKMEENGENENYNSTENIERIRNYGHMSLVCPTLIELYVDTNATEITDETAIDFLIKVAPDFEQTVMYCKWLGEECMTEHFFTPTIHNEGICHTFNMLDRGEIFTDVLSDYIKSDSNPNNKNTSVWSLETGYDQRAELHTFPRRTMLSGLNGGLDLIFLTYAKDMDPLCGDAVNGYKVFVQHSAEAPSAKQQYFRVPLDQDVLAAVKPNMMTTSKDLTNYDPEDRQCYFVTEKKLRFFKVYNQQNCLLECLTNFTYEFCGCVSFYMPRNNSTPICGSANTECAEDANVQFLAQEVNFKIKNNHKKIKTKYGKIIDEHFNEDCNCLPSCTSLEFDIETSQSEWDWRSVFTVANFSVVAEGLHYSRLRIYFKDMQFMTSERNQLYGQTDFWANCGGLLGLFTGFSFISVVEILYFATLRLGCNIRRFGRHYWSGSEELLKTK